MQLLLPSRAGAQAGTYFHHGVASGDPLPESVLLWTRVTPTGSALPGSGMGPEVSVGWQVATDSTFQQVVARGDVETGPARDHTVKVVAEGLRPATTYFYRFSFDGKESPVGRTKTAPDANAKVDHLRIAVASCANFEGGYFAAYRHLASQNPDLVMFLGDYIYEYEQKKYGVHQLPENQLYNKDLFDSRFHEPVHETYTLADYRMRYAQYRRDPDLQRAHQELPWFITWDDHDIADNSWSGGSEGSSGWEGTPQRSGLPARRLRSRRSPSGCRSATSGTCRSIAHSDGRTGRDPHARPAHLPHQDA
ncbi:hypothetical protein GTX14_25050 [Streptomyces sp. SID4944]|nr:hypothetical protein [Streptomyces sp. SID4944]